MLTREAAGISANVQGKRMHNSGEMPWNRGDPSSDVSFRFLFRVGNLPIPLSCYSVVRQGGTLFSSTW